ncbi:MAG TPA: DMT family transporter [Myxococcota bacterium]
MRAYALLALGVLSVGAAAILIREAHAPALTVSFWRTLLGGLALVIVVVARGARFPRGAHLGRAVAAGVLLGVHFWSWIASLALTSVAASVVLVCTQPIFVAILSALLFRERTKLLGVIGIVVAFAGAALIAVDGAGAGASASSSSARDHAMLLGDGLALLGAVAIALYVLVGRKTAGHVDVMAYSATVSLVAAASLAVPLVLVSAASDAGIASALPSSTTSWLWVLALALGPQLIGHTALNAALARLPAAVVSGSILGEPVIAVALAWAFLDEIPGARTLIGSALVLAGLVLLLDLLKAKTKVPAVAASPSPSTALASASSSEPARAAAVVAAAAAVLPARAPRR